MSPPREEGRLCDSPALKGKSTVAVKDVFCGELDEAKTRNVSTYSDGLATYVGQHRSSTTHGQVLAYNYDRMVTKGIITGLFSRPGIFRLRRSLAYQLMVLCLVAGLTHLAMYKVISSSPVPDKSLRRLQDDAEMATAEDDQSVNEAATATVVDAGNKEQESEADKAQKTKIRHWTKQVKPLSELGTYINAFVGLVLGLFISLSLSRWWILRASHIQSVLKSMRSMSFSLSSCLPQEEHLEVRERMVRRCVLTHALLFACARGEAEEPCLRSLAEEGLINRQEFRLLRRGSRHSAIEGQPRCLGNLNFELAMLPLLWNCNEVHRLFKAGYFPPPVVALLHGLLLEARTGIEGVAMMLSAPLPFTYMHLICTLVHGAALLSAMKCGLKTALSDTVLQVVCESCFSICLCSVYLGLLHLVAVIADPFGDDLLDFPFSAMQRQLSRGCRLGGQQMVSDVGDRAMKGGVRLPAPKAAPKPKAAPASPKPSEPKDAADSTASPKRPPSVAASTASPTRLPPASESSAASPDRPVELS